MAATITQLKIFVNTEKAQNTFRIFTDLSVRANPPDAKIYYFNFDGSELLHTETVAPGENGSWDGHPGRASTAQYRFIFEGWNTEPDQTDADPDALTEVYAGRKVYAAYKRQDISGFIKCSNILSLKTRNTAKNWDGTIWWSPDAADWQEWNGEEVSADSETHTIYLRGAGNTVITGSSSGKEFVLQPDDKSDIRCNGNIEYLLDYEATLSGEHPTMAASCFSNFFAGNRYITQVPELPATTLANNCYFSMFSSCTALTTPPELPATTLANGCYQNMFNGCSALTTPPELPATTLAPTCYDSMFSGCTALTTPPELPATTLADNCYWVMFMGCTGLTSIPELPAKALKATCYRLMFNGCTGIRVSESQDAEYSLPFMIPSGGGGSSAYQSLQDMFSGTGGTFTGTPEINTTYYLAPPASA